jgi:hypothetical protein
VTLTEQEEALVQRLRALPPETAEQVIRWIAQLAHVAAGRPVEWADSWSEEDLRDAASASVRNLETQERVDL